MNYLGSYQNDNNQKYTLTHRRRHFVYFSKTKTDMFNLPVT